MLLIALAFEATGESEMMFALSLLELPFEDVLPNWLPYVLVDDPSAVAARVDELGGRVLLGPHEELRGGSVAIITDPSGAALTIQKWPLDGSESRGFPQ